MGPVGYTQPFEKFILLSAEKVDGFPKMSFCSTCFTKQDLASLWHHHSLSLIIVSQHPLSNIFLFVTNCFVCYMYVFNSVALFMHFQTEKWENDYNLSQALGIYCVLMMPMLTSTEMKMQSIRWLLLLSRYHQVPHLLVR